MSNVEIIIGSGIISFILSLLFLKPSDPDEKPNNLVKILLLGFILTCFIFIGKATLDESDKACAYLVNSSTLTGNITNYTYTYNCETLTTRTGDYFYKFTVSLFGIMGIYLFIFLMYKVLVYFGWIVPHDKTGRGNEGGGGGF